MLSGRKGASTVGNVTSGLYCKSPRAHLLPECLVKHVSHISNSFNFYMGTLVSLSAGEGNPHHYFIATQDTELQRCLRRIAGIIQRVNMGEYKTQALLVNKGVFSDIRYSSPAYCHQHHSTGESYYRITESSPRGERSSKCEIQ